MGLKVLHTSDWHLGKQLMKIDFQADMDLFLEWLVNLIQKEKIDVLLMSGDLFDHANPSQSALKQYYSFLKNMIALDCKVIITGGNHDSSSVLNAPKDLLNLLDVTVVGGAPENIEDLFVPIEKHGEKVVVAAVPYLREKDIRNITLGESYDDKIKQIQHGIQDYFGKVNLYYRTCFQSYSLVLMGHLYAHGVSTTDSEREIQIGNQAGIEASVFGDEASYVALGHIHRPQRVGKDYIRYSGSPIAMSFSERADKKQVILVEYRNGETEIKPIEIPSFRKLITLKGTMEEVKSSLKNYEHKSILNDLIEIHVVEKDESILLVHELEELLTQKQDEGKEILKGRIEFQNKVKGTSSFLNDSEEISDYSPIDLFKKRLELDNSIESQDELLNAFREIMERLPNSSSLGI
jgi:DNA repair protein SbcD/Mre11